MSKTVKLRDEDYQDQTYTVPNGVKIPLADGSGMATAYFAEGTLPITANGSYDVRDKQTADVNVDAGLGKIAAIVDNTVTALTADDLAGATSIAASKFRGCSSLQTLELPDSVLTLYNYAFQQCTGLRSVVISGSVQTIQSYVFNACTSLTDAEFRAGVTETGVQMFSQCTSLVRVSLPQTLTLLAGSSFYQCSALTSLVLPGSLTNINNDALSNTGLTRLTCLATTPPTLTQYALRGLPSSCAIYVPVESVSAYKTASGWSQYASIIQAIPT